MPRLSVFYESWCPESGRGQQHQSERQRHTDTSPYYTQRKMDRETVCARSRDRDRESSVPCGSGAPVQRSSTVLNCVCTHSPIIQTTLVSLLNEENYSATLPPCLWRDTLGEHPEVKGPVGHRRVLFGYGSGNSWFEFLEAKEVAACTWVLPDGRHTTWLEVGTQRSRGITWLTGAQEAIGVEVWGAGGG